MPKSRKRTFASLGLLLILSTLLTACGASLVRSANAGGQAAEAASIDGNGEQGPIKVVWWHTTGGQPGDTLNELVERFNDSQSEVEVEAVYRGTDAESLNGLRASLRAGAGPALMEISDLGSRSMIDSGAVVPMQQFIDGESYDVSHLEENLFARYTFDFRLYAMPFQAATPVLYVNRDAFAAAGLDPKKLPKTYAEVEEAAKKLTENGMAGASFAVSGGLLEQLLSNRGAELLNRGNGRKSPADEALIDRPAAVDTLNWWKKMIDAGTMLNLGRSLDDTQKAFDDGQIAMTIGSTASLRGIVQAAEGRFEVGTAPLPKPAQDEREPGGVTAEGSGLWILNDSPPDVQQAAWKFVKFLVEPEQQADWYVDTGYFPITRKAYDETSVRKNLAQYPQFRAAIKQLRGAEFTPAAQGPVMGVFPQARELAADAIEAALDGALPPQDALELASTEITQLLREYNAAAAQ
ncbi:ABC transporter substrate-binding protein [Saccharibacillus sp. CPCC 101409]|uniref:ABC transporter substrate-binding protein n=1 Tax=Saccharibacillus sp. CPCC 101409 TaxID=3058041 RepID=UPI002670F55C|nr:ABC transporter substrate-binding protein [Saccharibacillus sp. CPCC 101409]MDO3413188.1 ABC transporter substrate-binding protein [Saccharibacillus sp. CPCC 101409]